MSYARIESIDDPRLNHFRNLKKTNQSRRQNHFVAEGVTVVQRLLQSDFEVQSVLVTDAKAVCFRDLIPDHVPVYWLAREVASQLVGYKFHMGVLASARRRDSPTLDQVLPLQGPSLVFVADQVIDPQNIGLLVRIAAGFGADALVTTPGCADPFSRRAIRVATGNCFFLPIVTSLPCAAGSSLQDLKQLGYTCCASVLAENAVELNAFRFPPRTVLVFGNETHGIREEISQACDQTLSISMFNNTDSLNVAVAAGIFGYAYRALHLDDSNPKVGGSK